MKRTALRRGFCTLALLGAAGIAVYLATQPGPKRKRPSAEPIVWAERELGVFALADLGPSVAYLVRSSTGLGLVDTGQQPDASTLLAAVERLGFDIRDLKVILLTHCHGDHINGAAHLRELTGARVYAGQGDCGVIRAGGPWEAIFSAFDTESDISTHPTEVDVELLGGETIELGDVRIDVVAAPGHTPGSTLYSMRRGDGPRILFSGDVIISYDELGTYSAYLSPRHRGDAEQYLATLRRLSEMPPPDLLMPGHTGIAAGADLGRARRAAAAWYDSLGGGIVQLLDLLRRYETDGRDFLDGRPREFLPGLHYLGDLSGQSLYCFNRDGLLTLIDAPSGPELVNVLASRLAEQGLDLANVRQVLLTSCGPDDTAGLSALVERTGCRVVASAAGLESIRLLCPPGAQFLEAESLAQTEDGFVRAVPLAGQETAPVAYVFEWQGKQVLAAGRMPSYSRFETAGRSIGDLGPHINPAEYVQSMETLAALIPDVWLPAMPDAEQNVNLYGDDWDRIIRRNISIVRAE